MPRNGLRWTGRWGWSPGTPGTGSVQTLACFGLWLGLLVHCLSSSCILACLLSQEAFLYLSPPFSLDSSRDLSVASFWVIFVFFHLNCFGLQSKEPMGVVGNTRASKRKDTKTHQFCLLWGAHQHQKLNRFLSTFYLSCCVDFFLLFPETKSTTAILASWLCGRVGQHAV